LQIPSDYRHALPVTVELENIQELILFILAPEVLNAYVEAVGLVIALSALEDKA